MVGVAVGALVVALAYPLAYFLVRTTSRWRNLLIAVSLAPLLASVIVRTYGWWVVLNREGAINTLLKSIGIIDQPLVLLPSTVAITIGLAHALLPYGVLTIIVLLNGLNPNLERAAMNFWRQPIPYLLGRNLAVDVAGDCWRISSGVCDRHQRVRDPAILGGPATEVMATLIRTFMAVTLDWALGAAMGAILLVSAIGLLILTSALGARTAAS